MDKLRDVEMQVPLRIYSADQQLITEIGEQRRIPLNIEEIPPLLKQAFLAAEDDRFYSHIGIDWRGTLRGVWGYARYLGQRRVPGGSTITQQVARRFFLNNEFSVMRKLREMALSIKIERELSKDEILELYMNKEFLGHRAYGVGAAAQIYYGKRVDELTAAEAAMIAALPKTPSRINPITNPEAATIRRNYVLDRMHLLETIDTETWQAARATLDQARLHGPLRELDADWAAEMARREAVERFGAEQAYTRGYQIITTIDSGLQRAADTAVREGLDAYDKRHGWRGPEQAGFVEQVEDQSAILDKLNEVRLIGDLLPAVALSIETERAELLLYDGRIAELVLERVGWAREHLTRNALGIQPESVADLFSVGDLVRLREHPEGWRLAQRPEAEAALVALSPQDGQIKALIGGLDFADNQFNRATMSQRQPGSAFKPFIYAGALDHGYTTASLINDAPIVFDDPSQERAWKPMNFSEEFFGPTRLREGMIHSRNLISVRLLLDIGLEPMTNYVTDFGFEPNQLADGPAMALGAASITPVKLAGAYAVFANGGYEIEPHLLLAILDDDDQFIELPQHPSICRDCPEPRLPMPEPVEVVAAKADDPTLRQLDVSLADDESTQQTDAVQEAEASKIFGPPIPVYARQVIDPQTTWLIRSMMTDVIRYGTGRRALALGRGDLAGKTGTTNDQRDTWFAGFNDQLVTTVWVGMDSNESLGRDEQGGRTALPIWVDFMQTALADMPEHNAPLPVGIVQANIDPATGLRSRPGYPNAIPEWFKAGELPPLQTVAAEQQAEDEDTADPYRIF
ncbi:MAG: PBP1A family penicillin-binding protein [Pseudomonadota bacterium]